MSKINGTWVRTWVHFMCSAVIPFQTSEKLPFLLILKDFVEAVLFI